MFSRKSTIIATIFIYLDTGSCVEGREYNVVNDDTNGFGFFPPSQNGNFVKFIKPYLKKGVGLIKAVLVEASANKDVDCIFVPSGFDVFNGIRKLKNYSLAD